MTEPVYPAPGSECICINDKGWWERVFVFEVETDGPKFMEQLKISKNVPTNDEVPHHLGLQFEQYPGLYFCSCRFRPLIKLEDEVEDEVTAPVSTTVYS